MDTNDYYSTKTEFNYKDINKIGGEFKIESQPLFIKKRAELWDKLFLLQENKLKSFPHQPIKITLSNNKEIDGTSYVTTPYDIAEKNFKKSEVKEFLVSKVLYSNKICETQIKSTDEIEQEEKCSERMKESYELWDMNRPLIGDCKIDFCNFESKEGKNTFWHSSSHLLGSGIEGIFGAKICIGKAFREGFYYDSYMGNYVIDPSKDFKAIEDQVKKYTQLNSPFTRLVLTKKEALELFKDNPFKVQLISNKIKENELTSAYRCGDFIDLCVGPHISNLNMIKVLKINKNSATNWLGKVTNDSLQRVYGIAFPNDKLLKQYIKNKEQEEKRDHRYIGKQQGLFMFHILSPGSCFWFEPGVYIYNKLIAFLQNQYKIRGYKEVISPNIFNLKLWKISGHYRKFKENMFLMKVDNQGYGLKPVNCPGHCLMYDGVARSYRDLPIRLADFGVIHRNDISGAIGGLTRAKRFQMDDCHIFCRYDQIMKEVLDFLDFMSYIYDIFGFKYEIYLSTRPEKKLGRVKLWEKAEQSLIDALNKFGKPWKLYPGHGAFYGPKIDITLIDSLGRSFKCTSTLQLDFQLPIRFNLMYKTEEQVNKEENIKLEDKKKESNELNEYGEILGKDIFSPDEWDNEVFIWEEKKLKPGYERPCIIHRAIFFSIEKITSIIIEHFGGKFPFWLSPRQIYICTINNKLDDYAEKWYLFLKYKGYQVCLDKSSGTLQKKIRKAQIAQFKYIGIIGPKEVDENVIDIRSCEGERIGKYTLNKLIEFFQTLEPKISISEKKLIENIHNHINFNDLESNEKKLKYNLYIDGDECSEKDKILYQKLKIIDIDKEKFPNLYKWKTIMTLKNK